MRSERCEPLGFFIDEPVSVRLSFFLSRSSSINSVYNFQDETTQVLPVVQGSSELSTTCEWTFDLNIRCMC